MQMTSALLLAAAQAFTALQAAEAPAATTGLPP